MTMNLSELVLSYAVSLYELVSDAYETLVSRLKGYYRALKEKVGGAMTRVRNWIRKKRNYYGIVYRQKKMKRKDQFWKIVRSEYGEYVVSFGSYIILYGLLINYPLAILAGAEIDYYTVPAYGLTWYFIKEEVVEMLQKIKPYIEVKVKNR